MTGNMVGIMKNKGREGHASLCKVVIKNAWPFSLFKGHLFGLFLHIHRKLF